MLDLIAAEDYFKKLYLQDIRQLIDCSFFELQKWTLESLTFRTPKDVRHVHLQFGFNDFLTIPRCF